LSGAGLFGADLSHADLSGAHLQGVDLRACRLDEQTNLKGILVDGETRWDWRMRHLGENATTE
jgi:uncharacterized protein YjbI with pentapeptide repeats